MTHGHTKEGIITPTYHSWAHMLSRCQNPKNQSYSDYGGRGITVCEQWQNFSNFASDMGAKPKGLMLERVDNDKGYAPGNCVWATRKVQNRNKRNNVIVTVRNVRASVAELAEIFRVNYNHVRQRLRKGWTPERAFFEAKH